MVATLSGLEEERLEDEDLFSDLFSKDLGFLGGSFLAGLFSGLVEECRLGLGAFLTVNGDLEIEFRLN